MGARWGLVAAFLAGSASADPVASVQLLWQDGEITTQTSGPNVSADSMFAIASVGKTMTAVMILSLVEDGVLTLDGPVSQWLPTDVVAGLDGLGGITVRHLLTMESGLPDYYSDDYLYDALRAPDTAQTPRNAVSFAFGEEQSFSPGTQFEYSNTNYVLLGMIAEAASNRSYAWLLAETVFKPAAMADSFVFGTRRLPASFVSGHERGEHIRTYYEGLGFGDGGVISSGRDLARFYDALFFERSLLSPASLRMMQNDPQSDQYGMGIVVADGIVGHSGADLGFSSEVAANLQSGTIAVMLVARDGASTDWIYDQVED